MTETPNPSLNIDQAPLSLEKYAQITAAYLARRGPRDSTRTVVFNVLTENNLTLAQWAKISAYWTPRVNNPDDPVSAVFKALVEQETARLSKST